MKYDVEILDELVLSEQFFKLKQYKVKHSSFLAGDCPAVVRERLEGKTAVSILLFDPRKDVIVCRAVPHWLDGCCGSLMEHRDSLWIL